MIDITLKGKCFPVINQCWKLAPVRGRQLGRKKGELFIIFSSILCLWFEIQGMRTYNFFQWVSNTVINVDTRRSCQLDNLQGPPVIMKQSMWHTYRQISNIWMKFKFKLSKSDGVMCRYHDWLKWHLVSIMGKSPTDWLFQLLVQDNNKETLYITSCLWE